MPNTETRYEENITSSTNNFTIDIILYNNTDFHTTVNIQNNISNTMIETKNIKLKSLIITMQKG